MGVVGLVGSHLNGDLSAHVWVFQGGADLTKRANNGGINGVAMLSSEWRKSHSELAHLAHLSRRAAAAELGVAKLVMDRA